MGFLFLLFVADASLGGDGDDRIAQLDRRFMHAVLFEDPFDLLRRVSDSDRLI